MDGGLPFSHAALIHRGPDEYRSALLAAAERARAQGAAVVVVAPPARLEMLRGLLGGRGGAANLVDITQFGRNPGRLITGYQRCIRSHLERPVLLVAEPIWPGRTREEIEEVIVHEALCNEAFADAAVTLLCPFDSGALEASVLEELRRAHCAPAGNGESGSPHGHEDEVARRLLKPLEPIPERGATMPVSLSDLPAVRARLAEEATKAGLTPPRRADWVLAVHELLTNSIRHGGGGELELWSSSERVIAEVRDRGKIEDPLVGRTDPGPSREGGLGLWIVNQLCDLVQLRTGDSGTTVRVQLAASRAPSRAATGSSAAPGADQGSRTLD